MPANPKRSVTASLPAEEVDAFDLVRARQNLSRSQALREAMRWYVAAMRHLPPAEMPLPDEIEALADTAAEFARGGGRRLHDVLHDLDGHPEQPR
jgi:hypothetical protein